MSRGRTKKTVNEPNINWTKHSRNTRHRKKEMENLEKDIKNLMGEFDIIKPKRPRSSGKRPSGKRPSGKRPSGKRPSGSRPSGKKTKRVDPRHKIFKPRVAGNLTENPRYLEPINVNFLGEPIIREKNGNTDSQSYGSVSPMVLLSGSNAQAFGDETTISPLGDGTIGEGKHYERPNYNNNPSQLSTRQNMIVNRMHYGEPALPKSTTRKKKKKKRRKKKRGHCTSKLFNTTSTTRRHCPLGFELLSKVRKPTSDCTYF